MNDTLELFIGLSMQTRVRGAELNTNHKYSHLSDAGTTRSISVHKPRLSHHTISAHSNQQENWFLS